MAHGQGAPLHWTPEQETGTVAHGSLLATLLVCKIFCKFSPYYLALTPHANAKQGKQKNQERNTETRAILEKL
jgi:hypothetical protein